MNNDLAVRGRSRGTIFEQGGGEISNGIDQGITPIRRRLWLYLAMERGGALVGVIDQMSLVAGGHREIQTATLAANLHLMIGRAMLRSTPLPMDGKTILTDDLGRKPAIHIQNIAPGPPTAMATATPAIFPSPKVADKAAQRA